MTTADPPLGGHKVRILPLEDPGALDDFDSGEREVDRHISKCCDWHGRYRNRTFCAFLEDEIQAVGFYCLGISAAESKYLDAEIVRSTESFGYVPFIYLNYIAVRSERQNQKIGTLLLMNALERCAQTIKNIGIYGVALHALNDRSAGLYERYGFREHSGGPKHPFMILPAQSVLDLFP